MKFKDKDEKPYNYELKLKDEFNQTKQETIGQLEYARNLKREYQGGRNRKRHKYKNGK